jgi:multisubunit Na+/H+ antiporter MnhC subunit
MYYCSVYFTPNADAAHRRLAATAAPLLDVMMIAAIIIGLNYIIFIIDDVIDSAFVSFSRENHASAIRIIVSLTPYEFLS